MYKLLLIAIGGAIGSLARYGTGTVLAPVMERTGFFPWGTLAVNLIGSLILGSVIGAGIGADGARLVATGLLGSFTTFSTWIYESHRLAEDGEAGVAFANVAISLIAGVGLASFGIVIGGAL